MEKKELGGLPPNYTNLGFDAESDAGPSAPNIHTSASFGAEASFQPPLSHPTAPLPELNLGPPPLYYSAPSLVFEDIYDACVKYVDDNCCYGSRFVKRMKLTEIHNRGVFVYTLETFGEQRESTGRTRAYRGGPVDGPENGQPPAPWDMPVRCSAMFVNDSDTEEIPHTSSVHICSRCDGLGRIMCSKCSGRGRVDCWRCHGRGKDNEGERCIHCHGDGRERCSRCSGDGRVKCTTCDGYGKVRKCRVLIVTWKNHPSTFITDTDNMPPQLVLEAGGTELFRQEDTALLPISNAPEATVNMASTRMLEIHKTSFRNEMILRQRHVLRGVPFTRVRYEWKNKEGEFYVYGTDRRVYFENYPQRYCCCTCC